MTAEKSIVFVTPSFKGDFERCKLLCETTRRFLPDAVEHILIVDQRDEELFKPLAGGKIRLVIAEDIVPRQSRKLLGVLPHIPVRGWMWQQLCKIAAFNCTQADVIQFVDSDVALVRPVDVTRIVNDRGQVRLQRTVFTDENNRYWHGIAADLLGIKNTDVTKNYVGNYITWQRRHVLAMTEKIERDASMPWIEAILKHRTFSEYTTYGVFCDYVLNMQVKNQFHDSSSNLHMTWDLHNSKTAIKYFMQDLKPEHLGIMIHSKLGIPVSAYRSFVEQHFAERKTA